MDKEKVLAEQQAEVERKLARIKEKRRKLDTRKKIIVGATVIANLSESELRDYLHHHLKRKDHRALFQLDNPNLE